MKIAGFRAAVFMRFPMVENAKEGFSRRTDHDEVDGMKRKNVISYGLIQNQREWVLIEEMTPSAVLKGLLFICVLVESFSVIALVAILFRIKCC